MIRCSPRLTTDRLLDECSNRLVRQTRKVMNAFYADKPMLLRDTRTSKASVNRFAEIAEERLIVHA